MRQPLALTTQLFSSMRVQRPSPWPPSESNTHDLIWPDSGSQPMNSCRTCLLPLNLDGVGADQVALVDRPAYSDSTLLFAVSSPSRRPSTPAPGAARKERYPRQCRGDPISAVRHLPSSKLHRRAEAGRNRHRHPKSRRAAELPLDPGGVRRDEADLPRAASRVRSRVLLEREQRLRLGHGRLAVPSRSPPNI